MEYFTNHTPLTILLTNSPSQFRLPPPLCRRTVGAHIQNNKIVSSSLYSQGIKTTFYLNFLVGYSILSPQKIGNQSQISPN